MVSTTTTLTEMVTVTGLASTVEEQWPEHKVRGVGMEYPGEPLVPITTVTVLVRVPGSRDMYVEKVERVGHPEYSWIHPRKMNNPVHQESIEIPKAILRDMLVRCVGQFNHIGNLDILEPIRQWMVEVMAP